MFKLSGNALKSNEPTGSRGVSRPVPSAAVNPAASRNAPGVTPLAKPDAADMASGLLKPATETGLAASASTARTAGVAQGATQSGAADSVDRVTGSRLLVGPDVKLKGAEILDCDTLVVEGSVEATMDSNVICIAEQGKFNGTVSVDNAEVFGVFEGDLTARNRLMIHATGRVSGKVRYGKLVIEEGGQVFGDVQSTAVLASAVGSEADKLAFASMLAARA